MGGSHVAVGRCSEMLSPQQFEGIWAGAALIPACPSHLHCSLSAPAQVAKPADSCFGLVFFFPCWWWGGFVGCFFFLGVVGEVVCSGIRWTQMLTQGRTGLCWCRVLWPAMEVHPLSTEFHLGKPSVAQNCRMGDSYWLVPHELLIATEQESNAATVMLFSLVLCCLENTVQKNEGLAPQTAFCIQRHLLVFFLPPGRKVLIVYAHQEPKSLNGSLKRVAVEELSKQGCSVTVSDLYAMQFEPRATRNDIVGETSQNSPFFQQ